MLSADHEPQPPPPLCSDVIKLLRAVWGLCSPNKVVVKTLSPYIEQRTTDSRPSESHNTNMYQQYYTKDYLRVKVKRKTLKNNWNAMYWYMYVLYIVCWNKNLSLDIDIKLL